MRLTEPAIYNSLIYESTKMATGKVRGYDHDFVDESLECPVCLLTLRGPHVVSCCGKEFCQFCIERVQRDGKPCPLCNKSRFSTFPHKKLVGEVNDLVVHCPQKELSYGQKGELVQQEQHLNPMSSSNDEYGNMFVECSYRCGAHIHQQKVREHESDIHPRRPVEVQLASLMQTLSAVTVELNKLREDHKREVHEMKQSFKWQLREVKEDQKRDLDKLKHELAMVMKENDQLRTTQDIIEGKCASLQIHKTPLPVPPFYFQMNNVRHYMKADCIFYSDPFYSHPGGYKMFISIHPNGLGSHKHTHLSLFIIICRGEFDDQLQWPFDGNITVEAYNRTTEKWSNQQTIVMNEQLCGCVFSRSKNTLVHGSFGYYDYIPHSQINHYIKDICCLRFRITNVEIVNTRHVYKPHQHKH